MYYFISTTAQLHLLYNCPLNETRLSDFLCGRLSISDGREDQGGLAPRREQLFIEFKTLPVSPCEGGDLVSVD